SSGWRRARLSQEEEEAPATCGFFRGARVMKAVGSRAELHRRGRASALPWHNAKAVFGLSGLVVLSWMIGVTIALLALYGK
ncbi:MAG: hypothetical protein ACE1Z8_08085, partial [Candidatus Acidiferrales bacterium]